MFDADIHMSHTVLLPLVLMFIYVCLSCVFVFPSSFKCVKATFVTPSVTFHLHCDTQRWTTLVRLDPVPLHLRRRHFHQAGHELLTFQSSGSGRQVKEWILIADELPRWLIKQLVLEECSASSETSSENLLEDLRTTIAKTARDLFDSKSGSDQGKCAEVGSFINEVLERLKRLPKIVPALKKIPADLIQSSKIQVCNSKGPEVLNLELIYSKNQVLSIVPNNWARGQRGLLRPLRTTVSVLQTSCLKVLRT